MSDESVGTLVIGAGQAGIAMSEHLGNHGINHLVLEKGRIAEHWRSARWDSLVANGPAWHDRFPNLLFSKTAPDLFPGKEEVADYFVDYAEQIKAPIRTGVEVKMLNQKPHGTGFIAETSKGSFAAKNVVIATGPFQKPIIPTVVPPEAGITQIHSISYRNPEQLPEGAVLVVGAGSSGSQIAHELLRTGRKVYLAIGPHNKPPRRYRGKDFCWWLGVLGIWDLKTPRPGMEHVTIAVSGAYGGQTVSFKQFAMDGMVLLGRAQNYVDGVLHFANDLKKNLDRGDADYLSVLDAADAYAKREGLELPEEPEARNLLPDPDCVTNPVLSLNLKDAGISSIIWATGFALDYSWVNVDAFGKDGRPRHTNGVSVVPGLYFLGLPWLTRRASSFIFGVWSDAKFIAEQIAANGTSPS
jgi:putative flavoprotein involved in K+ transport